MTLGIKKSMDTYIHPKANKIDMLLIHYISQYNYFKKNNIFNNMCHNLEVNYINNPKFLDIIESKKINFFSEKINHNNSLSYNI